MFGKNNNYKHKEDKKMGFILILAFGIIVLFRPEFLIYAGIGLVLYFIISWLGKGGGSGGGGGYRRKRYYRRNYRRRW
jgi:hypothetical protein